MHESGPSRLHDDRETQLPSRLFCTFNASREPGLEKWYAVAGHQRLGDSDGLPTSTAGQCRSDDSLGSFTVNAWNHRLAAGGLAAPARIPAGVPQGANRVFRQLVDREISPAKFEWRIASDNNRNDRQVRLVVGRFGQCGKCSRQVIRASRDQRDHQRVGFA